MSPTLRCQYQNSKPRMTEDQCKARAKNQDLYGKSCGKCPKYKHYLKLYKKSEKTGVPFEELLIQFVLKEEVKKTKEEKKKEREEKKRLREQKALVKEAKKRMREEKKNKV
jgi:hypothetical protein